MAVEAVADVIIQKLKDMVSEESIIGERLIVNQLGVIDEALKKMSGYFIDAENKRKGDESIKIWSDEYLQHLHYVEDTIEKFAFRIARQRKRLGFLMKHALFLKNFTACKNLNRRMKRIQARIKALSENKPSGVEDASVKFINSRDIGNGEKYMQRASVNSELPRNNGNGKMNMDNLGKSIAGEDYDDDIEEMAVVLEDSTQMHFASASTGLVDPVTVEHKDDGNYAAAADDDNNDEKGKMEAVLEDSNDVGRLLTRDAIQKRMASARPGVVDPGLIALKHKDDGDYNVVVAAAADNDDEKEEMDVGHEDSDDVGRLDVMQKRIASASIGVVDPARVRFTTFKNGIRSRSDISLITDRLLNTRLRSSYSYDEDELGIIGFKEELHDLINELTKEGRGARRIISIIGKMGSGKTTITRAVLATKRIKDYFKSCARVNISKDSTTEEILLKLLKQVGNSIDQGGLIPDQSLENRIEILKTRLRERLNEKRYLIVLDDVWNSDVWDSLKDAFPDNKHGGKIIITAYQESLAIGSDKVVNLKGLTDQESWKLFLGKAAVEEAPVEEEVPNDIKTTILGICLGLPLNIVLLGSLLSTKKNGYDQWRSILSSQTKWSTSNILALSYSDLPRDLKLCILYMVLFPTEYDIPVRRLLRLWLAEGFVKRSNTKDLPEDIVKRSNTEDLPEDIVERSNTQDLPEDVAQQYFDDLFKRSLIQISKQRSDGNHLKKCRLLGVLHGYLSTKADDINLFHVYGPESTAPIDARRLVEYMDSKDSSPDPPKLKYARSYLAFNFQKKDSPAKQVDSLLERMINNGVRFLRVLDLEGVYKPSLPENLGDFFHLRYLGLRWTFLDTLPSSVGDLTYLETLDLKHTYINSLPNSIWKLKHLRHLNLNEMRLDMPESPPSTLPRLLTLWGLSIVESRGCLLKIGLKKLLHLRELGITFNLSNCEDLLNWISNLTTLRQLRLRSKDDRGRPSKLNFISFSKLDQLSNMNLLGHLPKLPDENSFPQNIKVLSLSVSHLKEDPMPTLGKLKLLNVLRLLADSYLGKKIVCPEGGFVELRVLKLWMLKDLEEWELEEGAMPKLQELNIRCCSKLKSIPERLLKQKAFKEVTLTNMPEPFTENVKRDKSFHVSVIVKDYNFTPLPWELDNDTWDRTNFPTTNAIEELH